MITNGIFSLLKEVDRLDVRAHTGINAACPVVLDVPVCFTAPCLNKWQCRIGIGGFLVPDCVPLVLLSKRKMSACKCLQEIGYGAP